MFSRKVVEICIMLGCFSILSDLKIGRMFYLLYWWQLSQGHDLSLTLKAKVKGLQKVSSLHDSAVTPCTQRVTDIPDSPYS